MQSERQTSRDSAIFWLRWAAVLPAAIVAVLVATGIINVAVAELQYTKDGNSTVWNLLSSHDLRQLAQAFFLPMAGIWAGTMTAPAYRNYAIVALATLWAGALTVGYLVIGLTSYGNDATLGYWLLFAAAIGLNLAGILCVSFEFRRFHLATTRVDDFIRANAPPARAPRPEAPGRADVPTSHTWSATTQIEAAQIGGPAVRERTVNSERFAPSQRVHFFGCDERHRPTEPCNGTTAERQRE